MLTPLRKMAELAFSATNVDWYARNGYRRLYSLLGGGEPSWSGLNVTEATALNCSAVWACIRVISDPIGSLPLRLYRRVGNDDRERATDHPLYSILAEAPNQDMTSLDWRSCLQAHALSWGNGFSQIVRRSRSGEIIELLPIAPDAVMPDEDEQGRLRYRVRLKNGQEEIWTRDKVFHLRGLGFDGRWGYSVIGLAKQSIGLAQAMEKYGAKFFSAGGRVPYVLEHPANFKNVEEAKQFRENWKEAYGSGDNWHQGVILIGGMKYTQIGLKPEDAQFLASRQFQLPEICRWFRVSPHMVGDLSRATFSNIEHLGLEFLTQTLGYWLRVWEQTISRCLLTAEERKTLYAEFDTDALLRGDYKSRMEGYAIARQNGWLNGNDIRRRENLGPIPGGEQYVIQLNMQPLDQVAENVRGKGGTDAGTN